MALDNCRHYGSRFMRYLIALIAGRKRRGEVRNTISGLLALAWLLLAAPVSAQAGQETVLYKPGLLKAAIEKGETVFLHYKSTW